MPWSSFAVPWVHPAVFQGGAHGAFSKGKRPKAEAICLVGRFLLVVAALDAAPEGHDCDISAWMNVFGFEARLIAAKPHLEHVIIGLKRLVDSCRPPDALCAAVLHCAESFCREHKETTRYWSSNEVLCACEVLDYDHLAME